MLLIVVIALIASIRLGRIAREKGYDARKIRRYPWIFALVALVGGFVFVHLADSILRTLGASGNLRLFFSWAANLFFIAVYLTAIARLWKSLSILPRRRD